MSVSQILRPSPLEQVEVPEYFWPSQLASADGCRLRAIAGAADPLVPAGPHAEVGRVLHKLLERAGRGHTVRGSLGVEDDLRGELKALYHEARMRLTGTPLTARFADLRSALLPRELKAKEEAALRRAVALLSGAVRSPRPLPALGSVGDVSGNESTASGVEQLVKSKTLRLIGRPDITRDFGDVVELGDYKTGRVLDEDGVVRQEIALQLQLYALLHLELHPLKKVRATVLANDDHPVDLSEQSLAAARSILDRLKSELPVGAIESARNLASLGRGCSNCALRPRCPRYLEEAPRLWREPTSWSMPMDTWGTLVSKKHEALGWRVLLVDAASRAVQVSPLSGRWPVDDWETGDRLWFFALQPAGTRRGSDRAFHHPQNFRELGVQREDRRAWTLLVFHEDEVSVPKSEPAHD